MNFPMTRQETYEQIVRLTSELTAINLAQRIFDAAKTGEVEDVKTVFKAFKEQNPKLHQKIVNFGEGYNITKLQIFGEKSWEFKFDPNKINPPNFWALLLIARISDYYLFAWRQEKIEPFVLSIKEELGEKVGRFVEGVQWMVLIEEEDNQYSKTSELLVGIFKGKTE